MNELISQVVTSLAIIPIAYILLKLVFKKSIMFKFSFITVLFTVFACTTTAIELLAGGNSALFLEPLNIIVGIIVYTYINKTLRKPLEKYILHVKGIAEGNLSVALGELKSENELGILNNSLIYLSKVLKKVITHVSNNADNLVDASKNLSKASITLSQGAYEQASSIEEVSSTMEEISANIEQNSTNAHQTENVSAEASEGITLVAEKSAKAVEANKAIAGKISLISDIAFQTNILALNAAVEAARAGEHGKGFAVVASEVRKLAENSKIAAEQIAELINLGLKLSEEAREVMMNTLPKINNPSNLIKEIATASLEQNNGAGQVNRAIQELNNVTQQNAASSEELAASAELLQGQAEQLKVSISFFNIKNSIN